MKKNLLKSIFIIITFWIAMFFLQVNVKAASISISASKNTVNPKESVTITVSSDCTGRVNLSTTGGTLSSNSVWIEGNSQSVTLTAQNSGTITVTAQPVTLSDSEGKDVNVGAKSCNITVASASNSNSNGSGSTTQTQTPQKSNNAKLSNLGFTPNDFKGFTPSKTSYSATVPNSVSSVNIYANKGKGQNGQILNGQTITGTGKKDLQEGVNQFSIVVTAEDGTTKNTYNLSITREAAKEEEDKTEENEDTTNTEEETEAEEEIKVGLEKLTIDGITLSPSFKKDVYEYTAKLIGDKTKLDISTTAIDEGQIIEVIGNEDLKEGENVITITVQSDDEKETVTYQITVNKSLVDEEAIAREKAEAERQEKEKQQRIIIIAVIVVAIVIVGIILLVRYIKYRKSDEEYFDEDEEDESYYEEMQKPKSLNSIRKTADDIINNLGKEEEPEPEETEKEEYKEENYDYQDFEEIERKARKKKSKGKRFKED